jgi:hypothetical protein
MPGEKSGEKLSEQSMASAHLKERRENRYDACIEIEVSGIGQDGQAFHEKTITRDVSEWGCGFPLTTEVKVDDMIALHMASWGGGGSQPPPQSLFQILRVKQEEDHWLVGAWKMDNEDVWGEELPKASKSAEQGREARKEGDEEPRREDSDL